MSLVSTRVSKSNRAAATASPSSAAAGRRDVTYDVLRVLGLFLIMLAHVRPPDLLWVVRSFDVPLMVLVSGAVFQLGYRGRSIAVTPYLRKRAFRLLAPVYTFLVLYFGVTAVVAPGRFHSEMIWRTFLLLDGIGYVWVIRVFLFVALLAPFLFNWHARMSSAGFLVLLTSIYAVHEVLIAWFSAVPSLAGNEAIEFTLFYILPYSVIFGLGLRWPGMSRRAAVTIGMIALGVAALLLGYFRQVPVRELMLDHKYPPHLLYLWYGIGASHLMYALVLSLPDLPRRMAAAVQWLSASSLWIYLWHIVALTIAEKAVRHLGLGTLEFIPKWLITVAIATLTTYLQKAVVQWTIERGRLREPAAGILTVVFLK